MMHQTGDTDGPMMHMVGELHLHTIVVFGFLLFLGVTFFLLFVFFSRRINPAEFTFAPGAGKFGPPRRGNDRGIEDRPAGDMVLAIADISGYTNFMTLTRFSLAHAQYVVSELLEGVIDGMKPHLKPAKIEGDAVFCIAGGNGGTPPAPVEIGNAILAMASRFYARRDELNHSNLCKCKACTAIKSLELKIVIHRGPVLFYSLQDFHELSGVPVIVAHRMLKNDIRGNRYIFISRPASRAVRLPYGIPGAAHTQTYDDVGEVRGAVYSYTLDDLPALPDREAYGGIRRSVRDLAAKLGHNARMVGRSLRWTRKPAVTPAKESV